MLPDVHRCNVDQKLFSNVDVSEPKAIENIFWHNIGNTGLRVLITNSSIIIKCMRYSYLSDSISETFKNNC